MAQIREARLIKRAAQAYDQGPDGSKEFEDNPVLEYWRDVFLFGEEHAIAAATARRREEAEDEPVEVGQDDVIGALP